MSTVEAACVAAAITVLLVGAAINHLCRAHADRIERRARDAYLQAHWDPAAGTWADLDGHGVGPDGLRLQQDLAAHLKAYGEQIADLYDTTSGGPQ